MHLLVPTYIPTNSFIFIVNSIQHQNQDEIAKNMPENIQKHAKLEKLFRIGLGQVSICPFFCPRVYNSSANTNSTPKVKRTHETLEEER